ncbi:MAG: DUF2849 domain-containing protein [Pseudomonadota bacterium]
MPKKFTPKVLTANALLEGDVIYWSPKGDWVGRFEDAAYFDDESAATDALAQAETQQDRIVGPYLADARWQDDHPEPAHFREDFRTTGPSNYPHGKQAEF